MAKDKEIACIHYECEGQCALGKNAEFYGHCQSCKTYKATPGGKPARKDTRRDRMERINRREDRY